MKFNLRKTTNIINQSSKYITLGIEIFVPILLGALIGYYLLDLPKNSSPLWTVVLSLIGFLVGMYNLFKTIIQINKENKKKIMIIEILVALGINIINAVFSILFLKKIINKKWKKFIQYFYLAIIIRFFIFILLMFWFFKFLKFDIFVFSISFILIYFIILIFEILYINERFSTKILPKSKINQEK